jgi:excisionase family DNA binding protein
MPCMTSKRHDDSGVNVYRSVDELAQELGISRQSCYRGLRDGSIPVGIRIGKRFILPRAAVRNWLASAGGRVEGGGGRAA